MMGKLIIDSNKHTQPSFSFGYKQDFYERKPPILSKQHRVDYYWRDSPGVGSYSPEISHKKFKEKNIKWSVPREKRFQGPNQDQTTNNIKYY